MKIPAFIIMDYYEACEAIVSRREAQWELEQHDATFEEFVLEYGDREEYLGKDVLDFLGY